MLYYIGPVAISTFPFTATGFERDATADFVAKDVMGRLRPQEPMGEGPDEITISGKVLPFTRSFAGGLGGIEMLEGMRLAQQPVPLFRADGKPFGWRIVTHLKESHTELQVGGVGFEVTWDVKLLKVSSPGPVGAGAAIQSIMSLFA